MALDPTKVNARMKKVWETDQRFGMERNAHHIYVRHIVPDRFYLTEDTQTIRDDLQLAPTPVGADFSKESVIMTLAHTTCGDRINRGQTQSDYHSNMANRFASLDDVGQFKTEEFWPAGGGMDEPKTLAHVTVAHASDPSMLERLEENPLSYLLYLFDLQSHVGRSTQPDGREVVGLTPESKYRQPRAACGAIAGTLTHYDPTNRHHQRIREDLGEKNYTLLSQDKVMSDEGIDISMAVASAILSIVGMDRTVDILKSEMGEKGVAHLTATDIVNRASQNSNVIFLARATLANGIVTRQGFGTDASKYSGRLVMNQGDKRLLLIYDGNTEGRFKPEEQEYLIHRS